MNSIYRRPVSVNSTATGNHEREFLTRALNTAISRARLTLNTLETISVALQHKQATVPEVLEALEQFVTRHIRGGA